MSDKAVNAVCGFISAVALALMVVAYAGGCGGFPAALAKTHEGLKAMSQEVEPELAKVCLERAKKCKAEGIGKPEECAPLMTCREWKTRYALGTKQTHRGLANCNTVYFDLKKAGVLKK